MFDFNKHITWLWIINQDQTQIRINQVREDLYFERTNINKVYKKVESKVYYKYRFLERIYNNGVFSVLFVHQTEIETSNEEDCKSDDEANEYYDEYSLIQQI